MYLKDIVLLLLVEYGGMAASASDTTNEYRIQVQKIGQVVVQKNRKSISSTINLRGQIMWIV